MTRFPKNFKNFFENLEKTAGRGWQNLKKWYKIVYGVFIVRNDEPRTLNAVNNLDIRNIASFNINCYSCIHTII